jgi:hypothetical protein
MRALTKEQIDESFAKAEHQSDYALALYREAVIDISNPFIEKLHGWPSVSEATSKYIFQAAIVFDKKNHPNVMSGGLWLDIGFKTNYDMPDWMVDLSSVKIIYKEEGDGRKD